ncbi:MAG: cupredoxin domain-containing protein [Candidatus Paceibacterota bacterium]|jgi:plastocyanin domain-containing protein
MKNISISILVALVLIAVAFLIAKGGDRTPLPNGENNVSVVEERQIIDLTAVGGYSPEKSIAKAGIPTVLRFTTNGTFDCSSSVRIPSMNVSKNLAPAGITEIDLGIPKVGILQGSCGMGMYPFEIDFQN